MKRLLIIATVAAAMLAAGPALAGITVFKTSFASKDAYKSLSKLRGKAKKCKRQWRKKSAVGVAIKGGKRDCALATPVESDTRGGDQFVSVLAKVTKKTDRAVFRRTYLGVAVRAARKQGYELRVFPRSKRWRLLKNGKMLERGRDRKLINGGHRKNVIKLQVRNETLVAMVNRKRLAKVHDAGAAEVGGRRTALVYGVNKGAKGTRARGFFDQLKVGIPG